jgi:ABC-type branched-subunit amino acid transport system ATPase component
MISAKAWKPSTASEGRNSKEFKAETRAAAGCSILLVEQNVHQALTVCDRFAVIGRGHVVLSGRANDKSNCEKLLTTIAV